jgi:hypothetical protein
METIKNRAGGEKTRAASAAARLSDRRASRLEIRNPNCPHRSASKFRPSDFGFLSDFGEAHGWAFLVLFCSRISDLEHPLTSTPPSVRLRHWK